MMTKKTSLVVTVLMLAIAFMMEPIFHAVLLFTDPTLMISRWTHRDTMFHAVFQRKDYDEYDTGRDDINMMCGHVHDDVELTKADARRFSIRS